MGWNSEVMLKVADEIEAEAAVFNMDLWSDEIPAERLNDGFDFPLINGHECGTAACIAGFAQYFHPQLAIVSPEGRFVYRDGRGRTPEISGREALGLDPEQSEVLFIGAVGYVKRNAKRAAWILRALALLGDGDAKTIRKVVERSEEAVPD